MSTRAIAPVVGVSDRMVRKDVAATRSGGNPVPTSTPKVDYETGEVSDDYRLPAEGCPRRVGTVGPTRAGARPFT